MTIPLLNFTQLAPYFISFILCLLLLEQISYLRKKQFIPGPSLVIPILGNAISMAYNPVKFLEDQSDFTKSSNMGFSANYVFGKFILFIRDTELSHKVFANIGPDGFRLVGHPFGKKLFGEHNLLYMIGQEHKDLRRRIAPNFTPRALSTYTELQQIIILKHLKMWDQLSSENAPNPIVLWALARDLNLETSHTVFVGPYLDLEARERFKQDYLHFNNGFLILPIDFPRTAFRNARLAVHRLVKTLSKCAGHSKERMERDEEPSCLIDYWMQDTLREIAEAKAIGNPLPPYSSNVEMARHLFDFLFAAQDASTSSLLWAVTLLDSHPDILSKVREEVVGIWSPESDNLITAEQLREMKYTQAVAREVLRYRPPVPLLPHITEEDFPLTESYTIPKGCIVFPSIIEPLFQGFIEPDKFDPDRFSEERQEDKIFRRNFLAFGAGPHQCVGQRYALNHLVLFIAMFASLMDFKRHISKDCDEFRFSPTMCPNDHCKVYLKRRCTRYPSFPQV